MNLQNITIKNFKSLMTLSIAKKILIALIILVVGHFFATIMSRIAVHVSSKANTDSKERAVAYSMVDRAVYWTIMLLILMILPTIVGVETTAIIALIGSILFAIGLGLQGTLGDIAAGVMLLAAGTFKLGDYIELADTSLKGTVGDFSILYTYIKDEDTGVTVIVPNKILYNGIIYNHSSVVKHVVLQTFFISNENTDVSQILATVIQNVQVFPGVFADPPATCNVFEITPFGTGVEVRYALGISDYQVSGTKNVQSQIMTVIRDTLVMQGAKLVNIGGISPALKESALKYM